MLKQLSALALLVTACGGGNPQDVGTERTLDSGDAGSPTREPEPSPADEPVPSTEVDSGSEPEPGISVSVPVPVRPDGEPEVLVVEDAGREPEPVPEAEAGPEPSPEPVVLVDAGEEPEPEPEVDAGEEPEPEPVPEPILYWDGSEGNANNWLCRGSSNYTMTPQEDVFATGGLLHCALTTVVENASGYAYLDARIPHEGFETHKALTFWACGTGSVRAAVVSQSLDESYYSPLFELTGVWQQYRIEFDKLDPAYNPEAVTGMTFELKERNQSTPYTTDLRVDVLEFTSSDEPLGTSDVTCP